MDEELKQLGEYITRLEQQKKKMTAQQYTDLMVCVKGIEGMLRVLMPHDPSTKGFKVGTRIRALEKYDDIEIGMTGTVCDIESFGAKRRVGIDWDDLRYGHDCNGHCERGRGYYLAEDELEIIK